MAEPAGWATPWQSLVAFYFLIFVKSEEKKLKIFDKRIWGPEQLSGTRLFDLENSKLLGVGVSQNIS